MGARLRTAVVAACLAALMLAAPSAHAAFPGANGKIAFTDGNNLFVINLDGTGRQQVPLPNSCGRSGISWSPDGSALASNGCSRLIVVKPDGSGYREIGTTGSAGLGSWSPDSKKLVYHGVCLSPNACIDVYSINADGTGDTRLTNTGNSCCPVWSPDGHRIAFLQHQSGSLPTGIYTMTPDGLLPAKIPNTGTYDIPDSWSPDGNRLALSHYELNGAHDIYVINVDGSGLTQLTSDGLSSEAAWSPDGTSLVFLSTRDGSAHLYLMNADGTDQTKIPDTFPGLHPDWQPIPNRPPDCSHVTGTPGALWPPNGKLVSVSMAGVTDPDGDQVMLTITGVTQDEPTRHIPDAKLGPVSSQVKLRAKRSNHGDGRVYRIAYKATDRLGGECSGTATVGVPRRKNRPALDSAPPSYDSLVGTSRGGGQDGRRAHANTAPASFKGSTTRCSSCASISTPAHPSDLIRICPPIRCGLMCVSRAPAARRRSAGTLAPRPRPIGPSARAQRRPLPQG